MSALNIIQKGDTASPKVICLHGVLGSGRNLFRLVERVAASGFHAIAFDQRGHGHSPKAPDSSEYTLEALGKDVFTVMNEVGAEKAHLVGHSLGARVSLAATALKPDKVSSLSMLDAGVRIAPDSHQAIKAIIEPLPNSFPSKEAARAFLEEKHSPAMVQWLQSSLRTKEGGRQEWIFDLEGIRESLLAHLSEDQFEAWKKVSCPALVLRGANSQHFKQSEFEAMLASNSRAQGAIIPNAGHWLHVDNFEDTAEQVIKFLRKAEK